MLLAAIIYGFYISFYVLDADAYVQASATMFGCDGPGEQCIFFTVLPKGFMLRLFISLLATQRILYITMVQKVADIRDKSFA